MKVSSMFEASDEDHFYEPRTCCGMQISFGGKCLGACGRTVVEEKKADNEDPETLGKEKADEP